MIFGRAIYSLCVLCALSLLGACASVAPRDAGPRAEPFDVLGRVLVSYDGRSFSSSVRWQHGAEADELWLMTSTGQTLAYLRDDRNGATITGADQVKYQGSTVESLTKQGLGWELARHSGAEFGIRHCGTRRCRTYHAHDAGRLARGL
jgi:outer membrane lipoprotein LolB